MFYQAISPRCFVEALLWCFTEPFCRNIPSYDSLWRFIELFRLNISSSVSTRYFIECFTVMFHRAFRHDILSNLFVVTFRRVSKCDSGTSKHTSIPIAAISESNLFHRLQNSSRKVWTRRTKAHTKHTQDCKKPHNMIIKPHIATCLINLSNFKASTPYFQKRKHKQIIPHFHKLKQSKNIRKSP